MFQIVDYIEYEKRMTAVIPMGCNAVFVQLGRCNRFDVDGADASWSVAMLVDGEGEKRESITRRRRHAVG